VLRAHAKWHLNIPSTPPLPPLWPCLTPPSALTAAQVGLSPKLDALAGELSGGQRRKLSVSISFLGSPQLVMLDEPTR